MKPYLFAAILIVSAVLVVTLLPIFTDSGQKLLVSTKIEVPQNNSKTLGIQAYSYPPSSNGLLPPFFSARSVLIKDLTTDTILFQKESNTPLPIASTTKIMTALVSSEHFRPNSVLTVGESATIGGAKVGLTAGESLTFRSLLYGMLLNSGNDAAFAIAENYPGGVSEFVTAMNRKVKELNLQNTHFDNPAGFDSPTHYSTASDLSKITQAALKNSDLSRIFATKETEVLSLDKTKVHKLVNLNKLLSSLNGVLGVKTGYTDAAKENLVGYVDRDGKKILSVILGSDDRFGETRSLVEWTYSNFVWK